MAQTWITGSIVPVLRRLSRMTRSSEHPGLLSKYQARLNCTARSCLTKISDGTGDGTVSKSAGCSFIAPGFNSQHAHGSSQLPASGSSDSGLHGHCTHIHAGKTLTHGKDLKDLFLKEC